MKQRNPCWKLFRRFRRKRLKSNNQAFITLARSQFETLQAQAKGDLETRQKAIDGLVTPLKESLGRYEHQILEMEKTRQKAYGTLDEQLRTLAQANQRLEEETKNLRSALSAPLKARGRWGELTLRRVVELAGMSEHCDFTEQESINTESGRQRPDMIVKLPGNRRIAVDAKVPLQAFLDAVDTEKIGKGKSRGPGDAWRIGSRPHESVGGAQVLGAGGAGAGTWWCSSCRENPFSVRHSNRIAQLIDDGMQKKVVLATPTTLISLLRSAAYLWQQEKITQNAKEISDLGKELYERLKTFLGHFQTVGTSMERAVESYNKAVGSMESRVLVSARKFKELGAAAGDEIPELDPVDEAPRALAAPEKAPQE